MLTEAAFRDWLEAYLRPQERKDAEPIKELFAEDGVYYWGPFNPSREGVAAIYEHHRNALSHQRELDYSYTILAVKDDHGVARFDLTLVDDRPGEPNTYQGIFQVHVNAEGKCTLFEEWYHSTTR